MHLQQIMNLRSHSVCIIVVLLFFFSRCNDVKKQNVLISVQIVKRVQPNNFIILTEQMPGVYALCKKIRKL